MSFTIVTFCTSEYARHIAHWNEKCKEFGIKHLNYECESTGNWKNNTRLKPKILFHARNTMAGRLLYFDIDSRLLSAPTEPTNPHWDFGIIQNPRVQHKTKISSQCFWIADTIEARKVLAWWDYITIHSNGNDHPAFARALKRATELRIASVVYTEDTVRGCWQFNGQAPERSQTTLVTA